MVNKLDMSNSFNEKYGPWALITGASKGLGAEFARQCAQRGLNTLLIATSEDLLRGNVEQIKQTYNVDADYIVLDLSREDILDVIRPVTDNMEIGLVISNAGISTVHPFLSSSKKQLLTHLHINTRPSMLLAHHFGRKMIKVKRGGIMLLSSASANTGAPYVANYAGAKAYNLILAESLWYEFKKFGVDVLGFMPGSTKTPGWDLNNPAKSKLVNVMGAEETITEALDALGKQPSLIAGKRNRLVYFIMQRILSRKIAIKMVANTMEKLFGPFG